jgi:hypothetical protein
MTNDLFGIEMTPDGFDEYAKRAAQADVRMKIILNDTLRAIGHILVPAKGTGPLADETPKRSGKLARSTYFQIEQINGLQVLEIRQPAKTPSGKFYGYWVREGTPPHDIFPRYKKALRFDIDGDIIFAKHVRHPGTKKNPYHIRVHRKYEGQIIAEAVKAGAALAVYLSGKGAS